LELLGIFAEVVEVVGIFAEVVGIFAEVVEDVEDLP